MVLIAIQFIQPDRNISGQVSPADFIKNYAPPARVHVLLQTACYDCHSNNTRYPWYSRLQPLSWLMAGHIKNGKEKLNFSDFGNLNNRRQQSKLHEITGSIKDDMMPLTSYKIMHSAARLSQADKTLLLDWIYQKADSISRLSD